MCSLSLVTCITTVVIQARSGSREGFVYSDPNECAITKQGDVSKPDSAFHPRPPNLIGSRRTSPHLDDLHRLNRLREAIVIRTGRNIKISPRLVAILERIQPHYNPISIPPSHTSFTTKWDLHVRVRVFPVMFSAL